MKNLFKVFLMATVLVATVGFSSCAKKGLEGTTWHYSVENEMDATLYFVDKTNFTMKAVYSGSTNEASGTYTYADPIVLLTAEGETISGTVSGSTMTIVADGESLVFIKQ